MFDDFYAKYPRKLAKKDAARAWAKLTKEQQQKAMQTIDAHIAKWEADATEKSYIPYPASWLNGWRFDDEIEVAQPKLSKWWETEEGILEHGRKIGAPPRPGETIQQYRARLQTVVKAA